MQISASAATLAAPRIVGLGLVTGWGEGPAALRQASDAPPAALVAVPTPSLPGDRFRRATRECLLGAEVMKTALAEAGQVAPGVADERIGIVYASASGYAAANRAFLEDESSTTLHFPYTAPSAATLATRREARAIDGEGSFTRSVWREVLYFA